MTSPTPIADALNRNETQNPGDKDLPTRLKVQYAPDMFVSPKAEQDFMSDLVDAQQALINAQHRYLHDSNIGALAKAQHNFIQAQSNVLQRLRVFG